MQVHTPKRVSGDVRNMIIGVLLLILGAAMGYRYHEVRGGTSSTAQQFTLVNFQQPAEKKEVDFHLFWQVWQILEQNYLDQDKMQPDKMVYGAISGMTGALGDPYTMFLPPSDQQRSEEDLQGSFYGIGVQLGFVDSTIGIVTPLKGSPAVQAGLKAKDLIVHIKDVEKGIDKDTTGMSLNEAVDAIRGKKGTQVTLTIYRKDDPDHKDPYPVTLIRDEIVVPSAEVKFIEKDGRKVAHIILSKFGERTDGELDAVIQDITAQSPKVSGIVLDVRNNPGGYLDGAITVASEFVNGGKIVTQKGKTAATSKEYGAVGGGRLVEYPIDVVVNGGSASAAEIVAGALRDRRKATLIGEKTFGKGTVQDAMKLDGGAGLHVTIARWLLPNGDWIHEQGIPVGIEVKDDAKTENDEVIDRAVEEVLKK